MLPRATLTLSAIKRRYAERVVGTTPCREAIDRVRLLVFIIVGEVASKVFPAMFPPALARVSFTKPVDRELVGEIVVVSEIGQDFLDRAIGSAQLPIMDTCLAAFFGFSPFSPVARGERRRDLAGAAAWRFVHFLPRENHLSVGVRLRNHASKSVRVASPSRVAVRCTATALMR